MTTIRSMSSSKESFYTARSSLSVTGKLLNPIVKLNGKSYHLTVYHKKPGSDWEEITQNYLKLAKKSDFQEIIQQAGMSSSKKIEIQAFIYPETNSICCGIQNENRKIEVSLTKPQSTKIFEILEKIRLSKSVSGSSSFSLSKENLETLNSSFIKMSLEEIKTKRTHDYLKEFNNSLSENNVEPSNKKPHLEHPNKPKPIDYKRAIGLSNSGNNCCINATLQIILSNPELREIWEECFPETRDLYYKALNEGKSSAPSAVSDEFRKQLVQSSRFNLIDKSLVTQEDPTACLEVFFNACKEKLDLSYIEGSFERMKYKQVGDRKIEPSIEQPENHTQFRISLNNQCNQKVTLEELLKNHCLEINEIEQDGMKVKCISEDRYVSLPNNLIIDLLTNRKKRGGSHVLVPVDFHFPQELLKDEHSIHKYELQGFVVHLGQSDRSGHYITFRKVNGQWKKFDDNRVTNIDQNELQLLLGSSQEEKSVGFMQGLPRNVMRLFSEYSNPYVCMLSYSKRPSL